MNNLNNAIEVNNIKKYFKVYYDKGSTLKDRLSSRVRSKYQRREVLKGISFEVLKGEAIGLIGKNGCGKSTTLKLLTKIMYPDEGSIELNGRVSSLLELGAGFHPDMSGKENIYMNAAVFGLSRKEIDKRVDDIIRFSELKDFIDNPIRTYSSGMFMRLAFSVAINVDADILLIDEILAVGDISFQKKCFEKLKEIKMAGATIVIVSHSLEQIQEICDRTIWIENGVIKEEGNPRKVHEHYLQDMEKNRLQRFQNEYYENIFAEQDSFEEADIKEKICKEDESLKEENCKEDEALESTNIVASEMEMLKFNLLSDNNRGSIQIGTQEVIFTKMYITNVHREEKVYFETGEEINLYLQYKLKKEALRGTICLLIYRDDGCYCYGTNTFIEKQLVLDLDKYHCLKIVLHEMPLLPGRYYITIAVHNEQAINYVCIENAATIYLNLPK